MNIFSKAIKVLQYTAVIIAEYNLFRYFFLRRGLTKDQDKEWYTRFRKLGSGLSTARMSFRLGNWLPAIQFFAQEIKALLHTRRNKLEHLRQRVISNKQEWAEAVLDLIGGVADNWFFLCRIGVLSWSSKF